MVVALIVAYITEIKVNEIDGVDDVVLIDNDIYQVVNDVVGNKNGDEVDDCYQNPCLDETMEAVVVVQVTVVVARVKHTPAKVSIGKELTDLGDVFSNVVISLVILLDAAYITDEKRYYTDQGINRKDKSTLSIRKLRSNKIVQVLAMMNWYSASK